MERTVSITRSLPLHRVITPLAALAQSYAQPDPGRLQQLYQQSQVTLGPVGAPGTSQLVIHNYVKPGDAMTITGQFAKLADGTNYVQTLTINGSSKQLVVQQQNSQFQKKT